MPNLTIPRTYYLYPHTLTCRVGGATAQGCVVRRRYGPEAPPLLSTCDEVQGGAKQEVIGTWGAPQIWTNTGRITGLLHNPDEGVLKWMGCWEKL